jgi:hypothetical protein
MLKTVFSKTGLKKLWVLKVILRMQTSVAMARFLLVQLDREIRRFGTPTAHHK